MMLFLQCLKKTLRAKLYVYWWNWNDFLIILWLILFTLSFGAAGFIFARAHWKNVKDVVPPALE